MKSKSAKAKGRRLQAHLRDRVIRASRDRCGLTANDVRSRTIGECGTDLVLSEAARRFFPFGVEARNRETVPIWASIAGAEANSEREHLLPMAVIKRNKTKPYAVIDFEILLALVSLAYDWARTDLKQALSVRMTELGIEDDPELPGDAGVPGCGAQAL